MVQSNPVSDAGGSTTQDLALCLGTVVVVPGVEPGGATLPQEPWDPGGKQ